MRDRRGRKRGQPLEVKRQKSTQSPEYRPKCVQLRAWRKLAELTQAQLGPLIGEAQSWVSRVERGRRRIDSVEEDRFIRACQARIAENARSKYPATATGGASTTLPSGTELAQAADRAPTAAAERAAIAHRLGVLRKAARLTRSELAQRLRMTPAWVTDVERGRRHADGYELTCWMEACDCPDPRLVLHPRRRAGE